MEILTSLIPLYISTYIPEKKSPFYENLYLLLACSSILEAALYRLNDKCARPGRSRDVRSENQITGFVETGNSRWILKLLSDYWY
jgi:hypothetical protein